MYHRERVYDFEGVFLRDGYVNYFLFNPPEYSIGSTFGFHGRSRETLNDGKWHTVEWFRNRKSEVRSKGGKNEMTTQTGLIVDGKLVAVADGERVGVDIRPPYILGEDPHLDDRASKVIGSYEGNVMDFRELTTSHEFETERNMTGQVSHCIPGPDIEPV
ncbi:uncharacterized protein LOC127854927 [Dreissena polymorpha]|nr:uncharacterized protein LOC127854927 [Dreissena polymorpha]